jgi:cold shock CspA family protein
MIVTGQVSQFDEASGLGAIVAADGASYRFHCITIADGTRSIAAGQRVAFTLRTRFGQIEAVDIVKV